MDGTLGWALAMIGETVRHSGELTAFSAAVGGFLALGILLGKARYEVRKLKGEAAKAEAEAEGVAQDNILDGADKVIGWLQIQQQQTEKLLEKQREHYERKLLEAEDRHKHELTMQGNSLRDEIRRLERRMDDFGCKNAPTCVTRLILEPTHSASI